MPLPYTLVAPDRRVNDPSQAETTLLGMMASPGANQLVGFMNAARTDRQTAAEEYTLAAAAHNAQAQALNADYTLNENEQNLQRQNANLDAAMVNVGGPMATLGSAARVNPALADTYIAEQTLQNDNVRAQMQQREALAARALRPPSTGGGGRGGAFASDRNERAEYSLQLREHGIAARAYDAAVRQRNAAGTGAVRGVYGSQETLDNRQNAAYSAFDRNNPGLAAIIAAGRPAMPTRGGRATAQDGAAAPQRGAGPTSQPTTTSANIPPAVGTVNRSTADTNTNAPAAPGPRTVMVPASDANSLEGIRRHAPNGRVVRREVVGDQVRVTLQ